MLAAVPDLRPSDVSVVFGEAHVRKLFRFATKVKTHQSDLTCLLCPLECHVLVCYSLTSSSPSKSPSALDHCRERIREVRSASTWMADQNIATRPRRSAAIEAQVKVEESYEIW